MRILRPVVKPSPTRVPFLHAQIIKGYKGTTDILLAVERGEVSGMCSSFDPLEKQSVYKAGKLRILFQAAMVRDGKIDAPTLVSLIKSDAQRDALAFFLPANS